MNLPNWITVFRILLIPFFVILVLKYRQVHLDYLRYYAIGLFILAVITDALDGAIARLRNQRTTLGTLLDPLADKLLLLSAILLLSLPISGLTQLPIWIPVTVISRDLILVFGAIVIYINNNGKLNIKPNIWGKITTTCQMLTVIWILSAFPYPNIVWRITGFFTIVSGIIYVYQGSKQLGILEEQQ